MATADRDTRFAARAFQEARRYGSDPWVCVRELVQNARDAGARRVEWSVAARARGVALECRDDGCGMDWEHARRYLFRLYATSKGGQRGAAGRFGVGFWSTLRCQPTAIRVASVPRVGAAWALWLSGDLAEARREPRPSRGLPGTTISLDVAGSVTAVSEALHAALRRYVRGVARRSPLRGPLRISVNGTAVALDLELAAPSLGFSRGRTRGVVGLGSRPSVHVFSNGLLVRDAAVLDDLLVDDPAETSTAVGEGLAPCALLEAPDLEPLLSRGDVRPDRTFRRLVADARRQTQRLIRSKLDHLRPRSLGERARAVLHTAPTAVQALLVVAMGIGALVAGAAAARALRPRPAPDVARADTTAAGALPAIAHPGVVDVAAHPGMPEASRAAYRNPLPLYAGPRVEEERHSAWPVPLTFAPPAQELAFAVLVRAPFAESATEPLALHPLPQRGCGDGCTDVSVYADAAAGSLPVPLPTGHRLDGESVRLAGHHLAVLQDAHGMPFAILPEAQRGLLTYRTFPGAPATIDVRRVPGTGADVAPELRQLAKRLHGRSPAKIVEASTNWLRGRLSKPLDAAAIEHHRQAIGRGLDFETAALVLESGDCDVRNAMLARVLSLAGLEARLAVGLPAADGRARPWLHAWAEWRETPRAPWRVADASEEAEHDAIATPRTAPLRAATGPARLAAAASPGPRWTPRHGALLAALAVLALAPTLLLLRRRRPSLPRLDDGNDLSRLLRGALVHPEAWRDAPEVFDRALLPLCSGGSTSLRAAWTEAARGRLFLAAEANDLVRQARRSGLSVLAAGSAESRMVGRALGAIDLDAWHRRLLDASIDPLLDDACRVLLKRGERIVARSAPDEAILDLPARRGGSQRYVSVPVDTTWLASAHALHPHRPLAARVMVADGLLEVLGYEPGRCAEILAPLARAALDEARTC